MIDHGPNRGANRPRYIAPQQTDGKTKQEFQFDADPNTLMKQYSKTGKKDLFEQTQKIALAGDFSQIPDFFTALLQVQEVREDYENLPIAIKRATHNSPNELFELMSDPDRRDQCVELGLFEDTAEQQTIPTAPPEPEEKPPEPESPVQGGE